MKRLHRGFQFGERQQFFDFGTKIRFTPLLRIWTSLAGFLINGHAHVIWPDCKQTHQYGSESSIDDPSEVRNVDNCCFPLLSEKKALARSPVCVSKADENIMAVIQARSLNLNFGNALDRAYAISSSWCAGQFIPALRVQIDSICRASSFIDDDLFEAQ